MATRRTAKVARAIREAVSSAILFELRDPRIKNVTVLNVDVAGDLRNAKVHVSVMGDERTQQLSLHGLNASRGFLQSKVADRIKTRYTPLLTFVLDDGVKKSLEATRILNELENEKLNTAIDASPGEDQVDSEAEGFAHPENESTPGGEMTNKTSIPPSEDETSYS